MLVADREVRRINKLVWFSDGFYTYKLQIFNTCVKYPKSETIVTENKKKMVWSIFKMHMSYFRSQSVFVIFCIFFLCTIQFVKSHVCLSFNGKKQQHIFCTSFAHSRIFYFLLRLITFL